MATNWQIPDTERFGLNSGAAMCRLCISDKTVKQ